MMTPEQHEAHMAKVEQGLQAILASEDINEIKQIVQSLLAEEKGEEAAEGGAQPSSREQMVAAVKKQMEE